MLQSSVSGTISSLSKPLTKILICLLISKLGKYYFKIRTRMKTPYDLERGKEAALSVLEDIFSFSYLAYLAFEDRIYPNYAKGCK